MADCSVHATLPQPLAIPISMLVMIKLLKLLKINEIKDFGITIQENTFKFEENYCVLPNALVIAYALSIATSGNASRILLAGFDGYGSDDPRTLK